jgi:hypothetical protein
MCENPRAMARCEIRPFRSADFESARRLWASARSFWKSMGGRLRDDLVAFSIDCGARPEPPRAKR